MRVSRKTPIVIIFLVSILVLISLVTQVEAQNDDFLNEKKCSVERRIIVVG